MSRPRLIALLLALATLVVYLPATRHAFQNYDDDDYVTNNQIVQDGLTLAGVKWAFTTGHAGNWHPLTWLSHMADCELFKLNAGAHHFVNVLFHAANTALLFVLLLRLMEAGRWGEAPDEPGRGGRFSQDGGSRGRSPHQTIWPAALVAALFAWHPLHVESVAWIAERKDVLSTFFALLALLSYTRHAQAVTGDACRVTSDGRIPSPATRHPSPYLWLALVFFALGLMAKPMLVTLPFVLLLLDFWPLRRVAGDGWQVARLWPIIAEKIPFFLLTAASCVVTFFAQRHGEAVVSLAKVSLGYRLENAPVAAVNYALKLFWPADLCAIYPMTENLSALQAALAVSALALITVAAWRWRESKPYFLTGWLWFLGTLVPVIGLVQVGGQAMADRYTYIPSIGFFLAAVFLLWDGTARLNIPKAAVAGTSILLLAGCVFATEYNLRFWRDSETLFRRAVAVTQRNDIALVNLGVALDAQNRLDEALAAYREAQRIEPGRYQLHANLGRILDQLGRPAESLAEYREALRLRPAAAFLHNAVGSELATLGRFDEALEKFADAEKLDPRYAWPHVETAKVFLKQGRDDAAVEELRAALRLAPDDFKTLAYAARVLAANENAAARDGRAALALAAKANILAGGSQPFVFDALGMAFAETGDFTNAQVCAQNALDLATAAQMKNLEPLEKRLERYQNRQPWRESFRDTNAPAKTR